MTGRIYPIIAITICCVFLGGKSISGKDDRFSILFIGDILLANEVEKMMNYFGTDYPIEKLKGEFRKYEFIFGNLEAPITKRGIQVLNKAYSFRTKPKTATIIRDLKIDAVSLSNNHLMDFQREGLEDTIDYLDRWNIQHTGGGENLAEARRPIKFRYGNTDVYIFAYCNRPPDEFYATRNKPGTAPLKIEHIKEDIEIYRSQSNIILISLHWGIEHTHVPQAYQIKLAHEIIDAGADGIIGHHPHWPQGIEIYNSKPIIYSLGNFINGFYTPVERHNIMIAFYYSGKKLNKISVIPIAGKNKIIKFQPYVMKGFEARKNLILMKNLSLYFDTNMEIIGNRGIIKIDGARTKIGKNRSKVTGDLKSN